MRALTLRVGARGRWGWAAECGYVPAQREAFVMMDALKRARAPAVLTRLLAESFAADTVPGQLRTRMPGEKGTERAAEKRQ